jgi:hypothetical protein
MRSVEFQNGNFVHRFLLGASLTVVFSIAWPVFISAQAPPGPMTGPPSQDAPPAPAHPQPPKPALQPRTSIFGEWQLNRDDSDDPRKKMEEARSSRGNGGYGGSGPRVGFPGGGMGGGGLGGRRMGQQGESDDERQRMQELLNPPSKLTVAEPAIPTSVAAHEGSVPSSEVDLFDDQQRKRALFTDGRKLQKSKDADYQEIAAHWDGKRLATDEKGPRGNKMSRTFELSYDGTQLYETLHLTSGRNNGTMLIRYVYDASGAPPAAANPPSPTAAPTPGRAPKQ